MRRLAAHVVLTPIARSLSSRVGLFVGLAAVAAGVGMIGMSGCASDRTLDAGGPAEDWDLVRFHEEGAAGDLTVERGGDLRLQSGRGGGESSARGLLAGERLETLARLIGDLPLHSYSPTEACDMGRYFVSVTRDGAVHTYASDSCDSDVPATLDELRVLLSTVSDEFRAPRTEEIGFRILARGVESGVSRSENRVLRNRDELLRLLREIDPEAPIAVPLVDFSRDVVVAHFLGDRATGGFTVFPEIAERTENGWVRLQFVEEVPGPECAVSTARTRPYVLLAVERPQAGFLFDSRELRVRCR